MQHIDILNIEDFKKIEIGYGIYYLSARIDEYEITLEPHLTAGYTIAIYAKHDPLLSIKKRAVWKYNHPTNNPNEKTEKAVLDMALSVAQYFYELYVLKNKEAIAPHIKIINKN